jgi:hypothetical protein
VGSAPWSRPAYPETEAIRLAKGGGFEIGSEDWSQYEVEFECVPSQGAGSIEARFADSCGLVLGPGAGEVSVRRTVGGKVETLASCTDAGVKPGQPVKLRVDGTRAKEVRVYVNDRLELRTPVEAPPGGVLSIANTGAGGVDLRGLKVRFEREEDAERPPKVIVFTEDPFMKLWSSAEGNWWPDKEKANAFWHNGDFYGRSEITLPVRPGLMLIQSASRLSEKGGYALVQDAAPGGNVRVRLLPALAAGRAEGRGRREGGRTGAEGRRGGRKGGGGGGRGGREGDAAQGRALPVAVGRRP